MEASKFKMILFKINIIDENDNTKPCTIEYEIDNNTIYLEDEESTSIDYSEYIKKYGVELPEIITKEQLFAEGEQSLNNIITAVTIINNTCKAICRMHHCQSLDEVKEKMDQEIIEEGKMYADLFNNTDPTTLEDRGVTNKL